MGIKDLSKVISDHAPGAVSEHEIKAFFGRKIAVDASMSIYQFLIAVRQGGAQLMSDDGDTTSHLLGLFYRTIRMCENGIKPVYVFDGKPPDLKADELVKRKERRQEAEQMHQKAVEAGDQQAIDKFSRRLVKVTPEHNNECKRLLKLMGVPYVEAPCEAEAQCAELVRSGVAFAVATEDMDGLTFGANVLLRHLTFSEAKKMPIKQFKLDRVLEGMGLDMSQFVDLCIMLGCDYCPSIRGIGQKKAFELIKQHKSIESILDHLDKSKYPPPEDWNFERARQLFNEPDVKPASEVTLNWTDPDEQGLIDFLVGDKNFQEDRVRSGAAKLLKCRHSSTQGRIDAFFSVNGTVKTGNNNKKKEEVKNGKRKNGGAKGNPAKRPK